MPTTGVKICGITRPEDAQLAAELGADAIGLNFFRGPRRIAQAAAMDIVGECPPPVCFVGLLEGTELFHSPMSELFAPLFRLAAFQLYGDYSMLPAASFFSGKERWAVIAVESRASLANLLSRIAPWKFEPSALVLDTAVKGQLGGTGQTFNWQWIAEAREAGELEGLPPLILAGGLTPDNVAEAIRIARPYAVDVSSGVEVPGQPGVKDPIKLRDFIQAAKSAL